MFNESEEITMECVHDVNDGSVLAARMFQQANADRRNDTR